MVDQGFEMAGWLKEDKISHRDLRRIRELRRMSKSGDKAWGLRYLPLLVWQARDADRSLRRRILRLAADQRQWETAGLATDLAHLANSQ